MRILRLHPFAKSESINPGAGGMARVSLQLTRMLLRRGHQAAVFPLPERLLDRFQWGLEDGLSVTVEPTLSLPGAKGALRALRLVRALEPRPSSARDTLADMMQIAALQDVLRTFAPDIVHNHLARPYFPRLARGVALHQPTVLTHHHGEPGDDLLFYSRVVFNNQRTRERVSRASGLPVDNTRVVYHPVSETFSSGAVPGAGGRDFIAFIGAVRERKGMDILLDAGSRLKLLRGRRVRIIGGGAELATFVRAAEKRKLPLDFTGPLAPAALRAALDQAILVVVPSKLESFSLALSEAVCAGVPVVGWADQIEEMQAVLGVQPGWAFDARTQSADDLAHVVHEALVSPLLSTRHRRKLSDAARRFFSPETFAEAYIAIYRDLVG